MLSHLPRWGDVPAPDDELLSLVVKPRLKSKFAVNTVLNSHIVLSNETGHWMKVLLPRVDPRNPIAGLNLCKRMIIDSLEKAVDSSVYCGVQFGARENTTNEFIDDVAHLLIGVSRYYLQMFPSTLISFCLASALLSSSLQCILPFYFPRSLTEGVVATHLYSKCTLLCKPRFTNTKLDTTNPYIFARIPCKSEIIETKCDKIQTTIRVRGFRIFADRASLFVAYRLVVRSDESFYVFHRYSEFLALRKLLGIQVKHLDFPSKCLFPTSDLIAMRSKILEKWINDVLPINTPLVMKFLLTPCF